MSSRVNLKDTASAAICILIGGFFAVQALRTLPLGSAARMGPGYFPLLIGGLLVALGLMLLVRALRTDNTPAAGDWAPLRGVVAILGAPIAFGLTVQPFGLVPALFLTVLVSTFASPQLGLRRAVVVSVLLTGFCALLFSAGLGITFPLFGPWLAKLGLA